VKFLPPEDEIRAQLRELTSQTRRLRADLQGMITRRPSGSAFSDQRYRLRPDPVAQAEDRPPPKAATPDRAKPRTQKS